MLPVAPNDDGKGDANDADDANVEMDVRRPFESGRPFTVGDDHDGDGDSSLALWCFCLWLLLLGLRFSAMCLFVAEHT
jgi:hypothetical protein